MVLRVYCDESQQGKVFSIGAYLFTEQDVTRFEQLWGMALKLKGLERFHMTDFEASRGPYDGWDKADRINYQRHLLDIIRTNTQAVFAVGVDLSGYEQVTQDHEVSRLGWQPL